MYFKVKVEVIGCCVFRVVNLNSGKQGLQVNVLGLGGLNYRTQRSLSYI